MMVLAGCLIMARDPVPFATVEALAKNIRELRELEQRKAATQAELIRWCVHYLRMDPTSYRLRGYETSTERSRIIKENKDNKAKALLYLEWLATSLENNSVGSPDNIDRKEMPCTEV